MTIIWTIIIGFFAGVIAKLVTPGGNHPRGFIITTILGVLGAVSRPGSARRSAGTGRERPPGFLGAIVGAVVVLSDLGRRARPGVAGAFTSAGFPASAAAGGVSAGSVTLVRVSQPLPCHSRRLTEISPS
jgi:uncharacterized membrane protein YeaQ/YmgE (transglycosylase-associated protein family)